MFALAFYTERKLMFLLMVTVHVYFFEKGALAGGLCSLSLNIFIMVGQILSDSQSARMPAPLGDCQIFLKSVESINATTEDPVPTRVPYNTTIMPMTEPKERIQ